MIENEEQLERLLKKNLKLARENNRMLRSIKRSLFWGGIIRVVIWAIALGVPVFLYFSFFKPYVDNVFELYGSLGS